ncbi:UNKNOWN [Stylonychia lemnae]|uniref:Uncharacterized protein n=1 Tax=Stylonychia lemnae TaxID=5949 RepID=A0A077ZX60_STYLE|nr:UNKNOWN [Stylonychia lemnae]|eukprot:CDW73827.1 UNKNOWN [Stylonychia lemnae]
MNRFLWLNSYNFDSDQANQIELDVVESVHFQKSSHIISLIRSKEIARTRQLSIRNYLLMRQDLQGGIVLNIRQSDGAIFVILSDEIEAGETGMLLKLSPNLIQILNYFTISSQGLTFTAIYQLELHQMILAMGISGIGNNDFSYFIQEFDEIGDFTITTYNAPQLVKYDIIITEIFEQDNLQVGCMQGRSSSHAIIGILIHIFNSDNAVSLTRDASSSQRKFQCIGTKIAQKAEIQAVYIATNSEDSKILIVRIQQSSYEETQNHSVSEESMHYLKNNSISIKQFKFVSVINDFIHLGHLNEYQGNKRAYMSLLSPENSYYSILNLNESFDFIYDYQKYSGSVAVEVKGISKNDVIQNSPKIKIIKNLLPYVVLWKNQSERNNNQLFVSQLPVQIERSPKLIEQNVDCILGVQCEIYFSIFSLKNQCRDEINDQRSYRLDMIENGQNPVTTYSKKSSMSIKII